MRKKRKKQWKGFSFLLVSLAGTAVFLAIPFLDVLRRSFFTAGSGNWCGLDNYKTIFTNAAFRLAACNTLKFVIVCIPLLDGLALVLAELLYRHLPWGKKIKPLYLLPMALPTASLILLWKFMFYNQGFVNGFLAKFGIAGMDWMNTNHAFVVLVLEYIWKNLGYTVILWTAGLMALPDDMYEAASMDGAGQIRCFFYMTLPNLVKSAFVVLIISIINSFKVFREAYLIAGDYPNESMYFMQHLFNNWFRELSIDKLAAGAVVNFFVFFVLVLLLQKMWMKEDA